MAKGLFTQTMCALTNGQTTIQDVKSALTESGFTIVRESAGNDNWAIGGPSLLIPYLPQVNGYIQVDVVNRKWPDSMGDPKSDALTFGAWSMGFFGPLTFPGGLLRAQQHSWEWPAGRTVAQEHRGFVRLRLSYALGAGENAPVVPKHYEPLPELKALSLALLAVMKVPGVTCCFNPNGEVLRDGEGFREIWNACEAQQKLPLLLWTNVRFFKLSNEFGLIDTVGNQQMECSDVEAAFPVARYRTEEIAYYVRNITHYLLDTELEIRNGDGFDGPNETNLTWTVEVREDGISSPPRRVIRLYPRADQRQIRAAIASVASASG